MATTIRRIDFFHTSVQDQPGQAFTVLSALATEGVNLLAFSAVPVGANRTQLTLFPESTTALQTAAAKAGMVLDGPHSALIVQGDDELGALAGVHEQLYEAGVNVFASSGVTDGRGSFGYVIHVRPDQYERAAKALGL